MRYAITYENNMVFQHFGKTPQFLMVDLEDGKLTQELVSTDGKGHGALAGFLKMCIRDSKKYHLNTWELLLHTKKQAHKYRLNSK